MRTRSSLLLVALLLTSVPAFSAKPEFEVKPALLRSDLDNSFVGALRFEGKYAYKPATAANQLLTIEATTKGTLATDADAHGESLKADLAGLYFINLDPPPTTEEAPEPGTRPDYIPPRPVVKPGFGGVAIGFAAAFEADQPLQNRQWAAGLRLNYTPANAGFLSHPLVPHCWFDYRRVDETKAEVGGTPVPRNSYGRFGLSLDWQLPVGAWLAPEGSWLHSLKLIPNFQYYRSSEQSLSAPRSDLADAFYTACSLDLPAPRTWKGISAFRLTYADGRIPPATLTRQTVDFAVVVKWGR